MKSIQEKIKLLNAKAEALYKVSSLAEETLKNAKDHSFEQLSHFLGVIMRLENAIYEDLVDFNDLQGFFEANIEPGSILAAITAYIADHWDF